MWKKLGCLNVVVLVSMMLGLPLGAQAASGDSIIATKGEENQPFEDLASAFVWIGENTTGTVMVGANLDLGPGGAAIVPNGSDITLDLCGARINWTTTNGDALIFFPENTNGKLTINAKPGGTISSCCDSSEVTNSALIVYCKGNGDLTVNGGTFICSNKVGAATHFFKSGNGNWTFNDGTYMSCGEGAGGAHFLYCADATGTTRITGGTYDIRATAGAAAGIGSNAECYEKITITGGDFDVVTAGAWGGAFSCGNGSMVVDGGDFSVTGSVAGVSCFLAERGGTTILSNGTFRAETTDGYAYAACANMTATLTIAGGTYFSKAYKDTAATVVGKEQAKLTLVGSPVINNGATEGTAWNLAVQILGAYLDFSGYTGANLANFAVFSNDTYGVSYVTGDMAKFGSAWIQAGYFSTRPNDEGVQGGMLPIVNLDAATKDDYPWVIGKGVASVTTNGVTTAYSDINDAWQSAITGTEASPATLKLLADIALTNQLETSSEGVYLKFDLNDHVLSSSIALAGSTTLYNKMILFTSSSGKFELVDSAETKTKKYFTEATDGRWMLSAEPTSRFVEGGVITGSKENSAVWLSQGDIEIRDVSFVGNHTLSSGAALFVACKPVNVYNTRFYGNVADNGGGAIDSTLEARFLMKNCDVRFNVAGGSGGGISMQNKCVLIDTSVSDNVATNKGAGIYFEKKTSCLAAGTMILMADGREKAIEEISEGDLVATFDHEGGTNAASRVYLAYKGPSKARPFTLEFDSPLSNSNSSLQLTIVGIHDLLEESSRKYVRLTEANAATFVGKRFYGRDGAWHTLTSVTFGAERVAFYSIYSARHQNAYANGLLTVCDDIDYIVNIYELDENLKADPDQLAADIEKYGLRDFAFFSDNYGMTFDWYEAGNCRYNNIAMGKGLISWEALEELFGSIEEGHEGNEVLPVRALKMAKAMTLGATPVEPKLSDYDDFGDGVLVLGANAVVTNNSVGAMTNSNIYLATSDSKIALAEAHAGVLAGVALASGIGQFTKTNNVSVADVALFTSDDPQYEVFYTANKVLELAVPPHNHCICGDGSCSVAGHEHAEVVWEPWTSTTALPAEAGNWYLVNDVTVDSRWTPADGTRLCLNGKTVTSTTKECAIEVGKSFLITDCNSVPGSVLHASESGVGTYGVNVVGDETEGQPTGCFAAYRIALANHPSGGIFSGPHAFAALYDVAVTNNGTQGLIADRALTNLVFGGTIAGNHGYGIKADTATVVIEGALITGNASASNGGGIYCEGSELTLRDVTVVGNGAAAHGGGVYVAPRQTGKRPWDVKQSVVTLDGATVITNNVVGEGIADNLYLEGGESLVSLAADHGALDVGVTLSSGTGRFTTTDNVTQSDVALFTSDDPEYAVRFDANGTFLKLGYAGIQVGDDAWAQITDGLCTVVGTGDMWSHDNPSNSPLWSLKGAITRVVVGDSVTGVGKNDFSYMGALKDVEIGNSVTQVAAKAFYRCTYVTNLVVGAYVTTVGAAAFERCYSLETFRFGSQGTALACQDAFKIVARITMDGDTPVVDAVPEVTIDGWNRELQGKTNLTDAVWIPIDETKPIPYGFHFFKYAFVLPPE